MAIRQIRYVGDPILRKKSREVTEVSERIRTLIEDMVDTMYENKGGWIGCSSGRSFEKSCGHRYR